MKKFIVIVVVITFFLFLFACQKDEKSVKVLPSLSGPPQISEQVFEKSNDEVITIYKQAAPLIDMTNQISKDWSLYMKEEFAINISMQYLETRHSNPYEELKGGEKLQGMYYMTRDSEYDAKKVLEYFTDINEIIIEYPFENDLFNDGVKHFTHKNGSCYVLPLSLEKQFYFREYNFIMLQELGMNIPETLIEFKTLAAKIAASDYNGNEVADDYIASFSIASILTDFYDVFTAFNCYISIDEGSANISYNPTKNSFEDIVYNEGFIEALEYIKLLYNEKQIKLRLAQTESYLDTAIQAIFTDVYSQTGDNSFIGMNGGNLGYYLKGINESKLIYSKTSGSGLLTLKSDENPSEKIEKFIVDIFTDTKIMMALHYGGASPVSATYMTKMPRIKIDYAKELSKNNISEYNEKLSKYNSELFHNIDDYIYIDIEYSYQKEIELAFNMMISSIFIENVAISDAIETYKSEMSYLEMEGYIEYLNGFIKRE